jgi:hypothetical protein
MGRECMLFVPLENPACMDSDDIRMALLIALNINFLLKQNPIQIGMGFV